MPRSLSARLLRFQVQRHFILKSPIDKKKSKNISKGHTQALTYIREQSVCHSEKQEFEFLVLWQGSWDHQSCRLVPRFSAFTLDPELIATLRAQGTIMISREAGSSSIPQYSSWTSCCLTKVPQWPQKSRDVEGGKRTEAQAWRLLSADRIPLAFFHLTKVY